MEINRSLNASDDVAVDPLLARMRDQVKRARAIMQTEQEAQAKTEKTASPIPCSSPRHLSIANKAIQDDIVARVQARVAAAIAQAKSSQSASPVGSPVKRGWSPAKQVVEKHKEGQAPEETPPNLSVPHSFSTDAARRQEGS
jgi:hypothetical protein